MRGMLAALHIGDEELAYQYARKYAIYMRDFKRRSREMVGLIGKAYEDVGFVDGEGWTNSPIVHKYDHLAAQKKDIDPSTKEGESYVNSIDAEAKQLLAKATGALETKEAVKPKKIDEAAERKKLRNEFLTNTPVDPKGKVDILVFLRLQDKHSIMMGKEYEKLFKLAEKDPNFNFYAFSVDPEIVDTIVQYQLVSGATFNIREGTKIFENLGIQTVPSTMLMAQTTGQAVIEEGLRRFYYLDERLKVMLGKK